jgi:RNA-directed DNA polymerase
MLGPRHRPRDGHWYLSASPSKKSVRRIKMKIGAPLTPSNKGAWPEVQPRLNRLPGGWSAYVSYGALASAYEAVDQHVYDRASMHVNRPSNPFRPVSPVSVVFRQFDRADR